MENKIPLFLPLPVASNLILLLIFQFEPQFALYSGLEGVAVGGEEGAGAAVQYGGGQAAGDLNVLLCYRSCHYE